MTRKLHFLATLAVICFCDASQSHGQVIQRTFSTQLSDGAPQTYLSLAGNVDYFNSFVHQPFPKVYKSYENLKSITLTNRGDKILQNPFVSINRSTFSWTPTDVQDNIGGGSFDETAIRTWSYFTDRTVHRIYPHTGFQAGTPVELLSVFGYGNCFNNSATIFRLPANASKLFFDMAWSKHSISEFGTQGRSAIVDTDLRAFYWNLDNTALVDRFNASRDRHLIKRTHHYGRQYRYDPIINEYIANLYVINNDKGTILQDDYSLSYELRVGESMKLNYGAPLAWYADNYYDGSPLELANVVFTYDWDGAPDQSLLTDANMKNMEVVSSEAGRHLAKTGGDASVDFSLRHGFQSVFFIIDLELENNNGAAPNVLVSRDSLDWQQALDEHWDSNHRVYRFSFENDGKHGGQVYVRILPGTIQNILNIQYSSHTQVNRLALPRLRVGDNLIEPMFGTENDGYEVDLEIDYEESIADIPEIQINATNPTDGMVVKGDIKQLTWAVPNSSVPIEDYEVFVTRDTVMALPLAPNFIAYTNAPSFAETWSIFTDSLFVPPDLATIPGARGSLNPIAYARHRLAESPAGRKAKSPRGRPGVQPNAFALHADEEGFFNTDETYYWRVRALFANGVWSPWSKYFSFTVNKVMPPSNVHVTNESGVEYLNWTKNAAGLQPENYRVYGSNEYLGFEPVEQNMIAETSGTKVRVDDQPFTFFRIIAVDSAGLKSELSSYVNRSYPFLVHTPDVAAADSSFSYQVAFNPFVVPHITNDDRYTESVDRVNFSIVKIPAWMNYNPGLKRITGTTDSTTLKESFYSQDNRIEITASSDYLFETRTIDLIVPYAIDNSPPIVGTADTVVYQQNLVQFAIHYEDLDHIYGDSVSFSFSGMPDWLNVNVDTDSIYFSGTPTAPGDASFVVNAIDEYGDITSVDIKVEVHTNEIVHRVMAPLEDFLSVSLFDIPEFLELRTLGLNPVPYESSMPPFDVVINDFSEVTVSGSFCFPELWATLRLPLTLTRSGRNIEFVLILEIERLSLERSLVPYSMPDSKFVGLYRNNCDLSGVSYVIYNTNGQRVMAGEDPGSGRNFSIDVSDLSPGMYLMSIQANGQVFSHKLVRQ